LSGDVTKVAIGQFSVLSCQFPVILGSLLSFYFKRLRTGN
jgi:hypothetical protein